MLIPVNSPDGKFISLILSQDEYSAREFMEKYFDVDTLVKCTSMNTVLGFSDDWRC